MLNLLKSSCCGFCAADELQMLKVKLNNLLVRVGKMEGSSVTQSAVRETQDKPDMPFKRAS